MPKITRPLKPGDEKRSIITTAQPVSADPSRVVFEREVEHLRTLLPGYRKRLVSILRDALQRGTTNPAWARDWTLPWNEVVGGFDMMLANHLIHPRDDGMLLYDNTGWGQAFYLLPQREELCVVAGYKDGHHPVDLEELDDPGHWDRALERWHREMMNPPSPRGCRLNDHGDWVSLHGVAVDQLRRDLTPYAASWERVRCWPPEDTLRSEQTLPATLIAMLLVPRGEANPLPDDLLGPLATVLEPTGGPGGCPRVMVESLDAGPRTRRVFLPIDADGEEFLDGDRWEGIYERWCQGEVEP